ncbi:MAG TPA: Tol-Pal system protein TolB [Campylobacteraceae bacterium]|nr:Tol-Pal system protein TolB [Campylobacteraceae bacterium]
MRYLLLSVAVALSLHAYDATIEIVKKIEKRPHIAVADATTAPVDALMKRKLLKLLIGDLKVTTHFNVDDSYTTLPYEGNGGVAKLSKEGVELVAKMRLEKDPSGKLVASVKLINANNLSLLYEKFYTIGKPKRYPFLAHNIAIDINDFTGAPPVNWMRKYVIFAMYIRPGKSDILVSDYTLTFKKRIVKGGLNLFPKWANAKQDAFYYTSFSGREPTLYRVDIYTGTKRKIASSPGMMVCSDVNSAGTKLLVTMAPYDQPDIYLLDLKTRTKKRLTRYSGIDVSGNFVDNDKKVVFISERLGYPNIFAKDIAGGPVEQMVYHGKNNSSCSTYGKYIVYSSREGKSAFGFNTFNLYLISTQTDYIRKLTTSGKNLFPRFGDDGETILFIKYINGGTALGVLRLNANKSFLFPLRSGKIQSIDW